MITFKSSFSSFSVLDIEKAKEFYTSILGLPVEQKPEGLQLLVNGNTIFMYQKQDHIPATFTVLNFIVEDIDLIVTELATKKISMVHYPGMPLDEDGVLQNDGSRPGPKAICWFTDPSGNILSLIQEK